MIKAVQGYYDNLGIHYATNDIFVTTGGSEALTIALNCILDDGDEIIIPEPFYPQLQYLRPCHRRHHPPADHPCGGRL